jgi:hypothetical protein
MKSDESKFSGNEQSLVSFLFSTFVFFFLFQRRELICLEWADFVVDKCFEVFMEEIGVKTSVRRLTSECPHSKTSSSRFSYFGTFPFREATLPPPPPEERRISGEILRPEVCPAPRRRVSML